MHTHMLEKMHQSITSYLIGQISDLTLQSLDLPPQVFLFLIHPLSVAPFFSEVFLKDFHLRYNHSKADEFTRAQPPSPLFGPVHLHSIWPAPSAQLFESAVPASSRCWPRRQSYPDQGVVGRTKVNAGLRLLPKPEGRRVKHEHLGSWVSFVLVCPCTHPVEALNLLLLVLPLLAQGQQLILQVANLLLQLRGLGVKTLFLTLKHKEKDPHT